MADVQLLKKDLFGEIRRISADGRLTIVRDVSGASPWVRWLARRMMRREASALAVLEGIEGIPQIIDLDRENLRRSFLRGEPLQRARLAEPAFYQSAVRLLQAMHRAGVVHNDLAKEPNVLVQDDGQPAFIDFQLAWYSSRPGRLFRMLAYEDLRHLLKHKRSYCPQSLTARERSILAQPSLPSRAYRATLKPLYLFITRRVLGWSDREGAGDRGEQR